MKALRNFLDKIKPSFQNDGKYKMFRSTFDAFETFLFVPDKVTKKGSHIRDSIDLKRTMTIVIIALLPALIFGIWNVGYQHFRAFGGYPGIISSFWYGFLKVLPIILVSYISGLGVEFIFAQIRKHEVNEGFLVSGLLIPMIMPVDTPLWIISIATIFAVIVGKEVFGGTGMNIFNPALLARAFVFFAYPSKITGDFVWIAGLSNPSSNLVDGFSGATPMGLAAQGQFSKLPDLWSLYIGTIPGSIGETSKIAILIGAVILLITGIASFRTIISTIIGGVLMVLLFNVTSANQYMSLSPLVELGMGGFLFGAVFMVTDPVSSAQTATGKIIYGLLTGMIAMLIRILNPAYPEGMMLSILMMNMFAPLIDHFVVESNIKRRLKRNKVSVNNKM